MQFIHTNITTTVNFAGHITSTAPELHIQCVQHSPLWGGELVYFIYMMGRLGGCSGGSAG